MTKAKTLRWALSITFNLILILIVLSFSNCTTEEPDKENVEEVISKITVHFTPIGGGPTISVSAIDPDGDGPQDMEPTDIVVLEYNLEYNLDLEFTNHLVNPEEDITVEIKEEGEEHMIFFGWENAIFFNPSNGNITNNRDDVRYNDLDGNSLPIGLETIWTTVDGIAESNFRIVLKHQPGLKTASSTVSTGATDADVTFTIEVVK